MKNQGVLGGMSWPSLRLQGRYLCIYKGRLVDEMNFHFWNSIPRNVISANNFHRYDILDVFGMQIEYSGIFDKFPKNTLHGGGGGWLAYGGEWWPATRAGGFGW